MCAAVHRWEPNMKKQKTQINNNIDEEQTESEPKQPRKTAKYYIIESIRTLLMFVALVVFTYSSYELANIYMDYKDGDEAYANMEEQFLIPNIVADEPSEPITELNGTVIDSKMAAAEFSFDYDALLQRNPSALGWIKQDSTDSKISYPIVQALDHDHYLHYNALQQRNDSGAIFVDYRISGMEVRNCIIYGHNMRNGSMFGTLIMYEDKSYYQSHKTFDIYIGYDLYKYYVFAAYETEETGYTYTCNYNSDEEFQAYIDNCMERRYYQTDIETVTVNDKIITLSTCTNNDETKRFIVQLVRGEKIEK